MTAVRTFIGACLVSGLAAAAIGTAEAATDEAASASRAASAAGTQPAPIESFTRDPKLQSIQFSPRGTRFAALEEMGGRMNIVVGQAQGQELRYVTSYTGSDVQSFHWVGEDRLVFSLYDRKQGLANQRGGGLFAVDADGRNPRTLSDTVLDCMRKNKICRGVAYRKAVPGSDSDIVATSNERALTSQDVVRIDTRTGRRVLLSTDNPGRVVHWVLDHELRPRAALGTTAHGASRIFWYKDTADAPWRKIAEYESFRPLMMPVDMGRDGALVVASNLESGDRMELFRFDAANGRAGERIARHPGVDLGLVEDRRTGELRSPLRFSDTGELIGLDYVADRSETIWFDSEYAAVQAAVDAALPGARNVLRRLSGPRWFVESVSGQEPGAYYMYDGERRTLREVARTRPWLSARQLSPVKSIHYKARDGLDIQAYLTIPNARPASGGLPLLVWVHGGPWVRDTDRWDPQVQFFASRGYAVLQPNYRGSHGFGAKHLQAGYKQLGQAMQDDITDGVKRLVADGIVDPKRVCIGGASYGGYATLMGLIREPGMFRCGIDVVGVVDLRWWIDLGYTDFNQADAEGAERFLRHTIGDPDRDGPMMTANSPRLQAQRIQAPVLIVHGAGDVRVPIAHAEAMRDALRSNGKEVEWLVFPDEGHGFMREESRTAYFRAMEAFLEKHLARVP